MFKYSLVSLSLISILSLMPCVVISCKQEQKINQDNDKPKEDNNKTDNTNNDFDFKNADDIFPKIDPKDYYDFIEFENHTPIITDKLKLKFIQDVIKRVSTSRGEINFYVEEKSKQKVLFYFKWTYNYRSLYKTYVLDISGI